MAHNKEHVHGHAVAFLAKITQLREFWEYQVQELEAKNSPYMFGSLFEDRQVHVCKGPVWRVDQHQGSGLGLQGCQDCSWVLARFPLILR